MKKILFISLQLPLSGFAKQAPVETEALKSEALKALQNYNEAAATDSETSFALIGILLTIIGLYFSYRANALAKKANKIAKRQ